MNWQKEKFSKVVSDITGGNIKIKSNDYLDIGDFPIVDQGSSFIGGYINHKVAVKRKYPVIVFGDHSKALKYIDFDFCLGADGVKVLEPKYDNLHSKFLYYYLMTIKLPEVGYSRHFKFLKEIEIPLPPLDVQKKIADILDEADALRKKDAELVKKYAELAQSIFIDMFGDPVTNPKGWEIKKLSEICIKITDGTHSTPNYTDIGVPFLRVTDITGSNDSKKFISQLEHRQLIKRCKPERGDILYSKNGTIGVAKVVDWDYEFSIFVSLCLLKIKKEIILSEYLSNYLNTPIALNQAKKHSKTGTVTNLHLNEIKEILVPVPCIELQKQYLEQVNNIKLAREIINNNSEQLFQSLLQRAFNGELVH